MVTVALRPAPNVPMSQTIFGSPKSLHVPKVVVVAADRVNPLGMVSVTMTLSASEPELVTTMV
jgi:hypothetical protein